MALNANAPTSEIEFSSKFNTFTVVIFHSSIKVSLRAFRPPSKSQFRLIRIVVKAQDFYRNCKWEKCFKSVKHTVDFGHGNFDIAFYLVLVAFQV